MTIVALPKFQGAAKRTPDEREAFVRIIVNAGYDPVAVGAIIELESARSWNPRIRGSNAFTMRPYYAIGLIQWSPDTAQKLGTSTAALEHMSFLEQVAFIPKYYAMFGGPSKFARPADYYAAGFGTGVGAADSWVMAAKGDVRYDANAGLDTNQDGQITMSDLSTLVTRAVAEASKNGSWSFDLDATTIGAVRARYVTASPLQAAELQLVMKWAKVGQ